MSHTTESAAATDPVAAELVNTNFLTRWACHLCGGHTEKVSTLTEVRDGPYEGFRVCETCIERISQGASLDAMLEAHALALTEEAARYARELRALVGRLRVPTFQEWRRAESKHVMALRASFEAAGDTPACVGEPPNDDIPF